MGQTLSCLRTPQAANEVPRPQVVRRPVNASELRRPTTRRHTTAARDEGEVRRSRALASSHTALATGAAPHFLTETARQDARSDRSVTTSEPARLGSDLGTSGRAPEPAWRADVKRRTEAVKRASSPVRRQSSSLDSIALQSRRLSAPVARDRANSMNGSVTSESTQRTKRNGTTGSGSLGGARRSVAASDKVYERAKRHSSVETRAAAGRKGGGTGNKVQDWGKRHFSNLETKASEERGGGLGGSRMQLKAKRHSSVDTRATRRTDKGAGNQERESVMRENKAVTGHGPLHGRRRVHFDEVGTRAIAWRRGHEPKDSLDELEDTAFEEAQPEEEAGWSPAGKSLVQLGIEKFDARTGEKALPSTRTIVTRQPSRIDGDEDGGLSGVPETS